MLWWGKKRIELVWLWVVNQFLVVCISNHAVEEAGSQVSVSRSGWTCIHQLVFQINVADFCIENPRASDDVDRWYIKYVIPEISGSE